MRETPPAASVHCCSLRVGCAIASPSVSLPTRGESPSTMEQDPMHRDAMSREVTSVTSPLVRWVRDTLPSLGRQRLVSRAARFYGVVLLLSSASFALVGLAGSSPGALLLAVAGVCALPGVLLLLYSTRPRGVFKPANAVRDARATRVAAYLSLRSASQTVAEIAHGLGWTEDAVVDGLAALREAGRIEEDLDLESGHWTYLLLPTDAGECRPLASLPLSERVVACTTEESRS